LQFSLQAASPETFGYTLLYLNTDADMAEAGQFEYDRAVFASGERHQKEIEVHILLVSVDRGRLAVIWRTLMTLNCRTISSFDMPSVGVSLGRRRKTGLTGSSDLGWKA